jgi:hypothetical protein
MAASKKEDNSGQVQKTGDNSRYNNQKANQKTASTSMLNTML